ncbi:sulfite exporter TauE/SafE family protein [Sulfurovum mangrovi]|uniref:sulfite exporter TauE/SafE family protein n=1 Tax=Sulfurovum mangrovi TaxID=2893889 RepID=UPI001E64621C|nr:sulfite exporter TauE/SafE family protein [Sulfurovum mangrovi]UFH60147.1 sulfite exporter TauE/SafE family protein [Sulfurovum mangrovi]
MMMELIPVGILVGAMSGFFGIGGGTMLVPILLAIGFSTKDAIGISIIQMVFSSIYGSYLNHKKGSLILGDGILVGLGGFVGGFIGGYVTQFIADRILEFLFLGLLFFALFRLLTAKHVEDDSQTRTINKAVLFAIGLVIGIFAITLGVGGSIVLTPILVGLLHYPIKKAVSAGLFFVVFSSVAGMSSRLLTGTIDFENGLIVAVASMVGVWGGIWLKDHVKSTHHKIALLVMYVVAIAILIDKMWF